MARMRTPSSGLPYFSASALATSPSFIVGFLLIGSGSSSGEPSDSKPRPDRLTGPSDRIARMRGIISAGGYLPYRRLDRASISEFLGSGGGRGQRTVASYDEDTTTMGVEAGR